MKLSVIMITYGHEEYIEAAINGVLMQDCNFSFELIVADDNSPDQTMFIVEKLKSQHPKGSIIKYTKHQKNKGPNPNFLWASKQCKGKYIAICEGDDYWTDPLKLQKQVDFLEANEDYAICGSLANVIYEDEEILSDIEGEAGVFNQLDLAQRNFIPTASALIKREHIFNLPYWFTDCPIGDWPLFLICSGYGKIKIFNEAMVVRRVHAGGIWGANLNNKKSFKNNQSLLHFFTIIRDKFSSEINVLLHQNYIKQVIKLSQLHLKQNNFSEVKRYMQILFLEGYNLTQETNTLAEAITSKMTAQDKELKAIKAFNTTLITSMSYKLGRKITSLFSVK